MKTLLLQAKDLLRNAVNLWVPREDQMVCAFFSRTPHSTLGQGLLPQCLTKNIRYLLGNRAITQLVSLLDYSPQQASAGR